jgi:hypothetical protein
MKMLLLAACLLALQQAGQAATIQVGGRQGGWTLGIPYSPIEANVGDELVGCVPLCLSRAAWVFSAAIASPASLT